MQYIEKDITTVTTGVVAHGVNCQGAMNSGVAKAIRKKWPEVFDAYLKNSIGKTMLGVCHMIDITPELYVANCYTQVFYGHNGRFADPEAIEKAVRQAYKYADIYGLPLYLPKIGAKRGGLDWNTEVEPIIKKLDEEFGRVDTYICIWKE